VARRSATRCGIPPSIFRLATTWRTLDIDYVGELAAESRDFLLGVISDAPNHDLFSIDERIVRARIESLWVSDARHP
jgi:hypothetical protein